MIDEYTCYQIFNITRETIVETFYSPSRPRACPHHKGAGIQKAGPETVCSYRPARPTGRRPSPCQSDPAPSLRPTGPRNPNSNQTVIHK